MRATADKRHHLVTCNNVTAKVEDFNIKDITAEKRLDIIKFDSKLSSENNVSSLCIKASQKLHALARIFNYMDKEKR